MPDLATLGLFFSAAFVLAVTPGPGIFYVMTRSLKGGKPEGFASAMGTSVGGLFHVVAAALGVSVLLATSAIAFSLMKYLGVAYLVFLGIKTILSKDTVISEGSGAVVGYRRAFFQGVAVEVLNPKTALFFLAFIPQFVNPSGVVFLQFLLLGIISVVLNTLVDLIVIALAGPIGQKLRTSPKLRKRQRIATGVGLVSLGGYIAFAGTGES